MNGPVRRIVIVTSRFPYGTAEPYLGTELDELAKHFEYVALAPVRPGRGRAREVPAGAEVLSWRLFGVQTLWRALRAAFRDPRGVGAAAGQLLSSGDPGRFKNAFVLLKGIALGDWMRERRFTHVHAYWLSTPASVAVVAARVAGAAWSATAHRWDIYERNAFDVKARTAAFVRTISARGAADLWERMPGLADRILHVRLGAIVPEQPAAHPSRSARLALVCPAALVPVKGHADLLSAIERLRSWGAPVHCTIAGSGPLREVLERRVESMGLREHVSFAGFIPQKELHRRYRDGEYDAVVLASRSDGRREMEGVPSALIEAMAAGVPVVATDSGSIGELVDASSGWLVPSSHPGLLARALLEVYLNPETARARARRAYEIVAERHDVRKQMSALAAMLSGERSMT